MKSAETILNETLEKNGVKTALTFTKRAILEAMEEYKNQALSAITKIK